MTCIMNTMREGMKKFAQAVEAARYKEKKGDRNFTGMLAHLIYCRYEQAGNNDHKETIPDPIRFKERENENGCEEKNEKKHALVAGAAKSCPKADPGSPDSSQFHGMFTDTHIYSSAHRGVKARDQVCFAENKN